ncbi:MAG: quinone oxidoreductase [Acidobacteria bacterium]|nr:quinone oxidoreductase [Acidobacteriota bacterium]
MKAILVRETGGPEKLLLEDVPVPMPGPGQALVRVSVSGVNFIDIYFRIGLYKADLPFTPGMEASGVVEAIGEGVTEVAPDDRVAYAMQRGSYAQYAVVPAWQLVKVPEKLTLDRAAAVMLQGMTAHYLTHSTFPLQQGQSCLVHAAAGGAGQMVVQLAKKRGARVIATVGSESKAELARDAGADEVILYNSQDWVAETRKLTEGKGVDVVYDSVGAATFEGSLNCLRPRGMMVTYGNASGPVPAIEPLLLNQKGSLFLTRPTLAHHCATRQELLWRAGDVLGGLASGELSLHIHKTYSLAEAGASHEDLASRRTTGKLLIDVNA